MPEPPKRGQMHKGLPEMLITDAIERMSRDGH